MNPPDPEDRRSGKDRVSGKPGIERTGDVYQHGNEIAIAHTGQGDILISIAGERLAIDIPALLSGRISAPSASIPHTLPRDTPEFTGRSDELGVLTGAIEQAAQSGRPVIICAIEGMAGVGKTALAVHAAHDLKSRFPDGQLFMRLHAHTPGAMPVEPADALTALLHEIGVKSDEIPDSLDLKASMWRDRLADKEILVLLDDAASHAQILPLIPGAGRSAVVVTSRHRLEEFGGDPRLELDVLPVQEAVELFTRLSGQSDTGPGAIADLVELAGRLPLAISILAGRLHSRPTWEVADLIDELTAARDRSAAIGAIDQPVSAVFNMSYNPLPAQRRDFFRKLGLNPGTDIDSYAAAAVAGMELEDARRQLDELYADHLIEEPIRGRYRFHDLLSDYARALATIDPPEEQEAAISRLLAYYVYTAGLGSRYVSRTPPVGVIPKLYAPRYAPDITTRAQAVEWMKAERANLQRITEYCRGERPRYVIAIPAAIAEFLLIAGHWSQSQILLTMALAAAHQVGDELGEAVILNSLGLLQRVTGDYGKAASSLNRAQDLYSVIGDKLGQANALTNLGPVQDLTGKHVEAADSYARALELYRALGNRIGEANALINLGIVHDRTGDRVLAVATLGEALELQRVYGDDEGEATALTNIGVVQLNAGDHAAAAASLGQALELYRALGDRFGQADVLNDLGITQDRIGMYSAAATSLIEARELFRALGDKVGEAYAVTNIGDLQRHKGDYAAAQVTLTDALQLWEPLDEENGTATALAGLGDVQRYEGNHDAARTTLTKALTIFRAFGDLPSQAECLNTMGDLSIDSSANSEAEEFFDKALTIAREASVPLQEARALEGLGQCHLRAGRPDQAAAVLRQARTIYQKLDSPLAQRLETIAGPET
jgi:tetratricopeptide (TPR) repeat protein